MAKGRLENWLKRLRVLSALARDPRLIPSTHMALTIICDPSPCEYDALF